MYYYESYHRHCHWQVMTEWVMERNLRWRGLIIALWYPGSGPGRRLGRETRLLLCEPPRISSLRIATSWWLRCEWLAELAPHRGDSQLRSHRDRTGSLGNWRPELGTHLLAAARGSSGARYRWNTGTLRGVTSMHFHKYPLGEVEVERTSWGRSTTDWLSHGLPYRESFHKAAHTWSLHPSRSPSRPGCG